jgi:signal transduction histidine kinase
MAAVPAIRSRLANAVMAWSLLWGLAVGAAVWMAATHEVDELLDDALRSSAQLLGALALDPASAGLSERLLQVDAAAPPGAERFAWQVIGADGSLRLRSARAPAQAWRRTPSAGFSDAADWRLYGQALGVDGLMLYAAQSRDERQEARAEVALGAVLAALAVGLLGHLWLRLRVRAELQPLQQLSDRLAGWDVEAEAGTAALGPAQREELVLVHQAIEQLAARLAGRIANERAFAAHAAHALRTPLAGIDAQLAVALRDCPPALAERLQRVRGAAARLQTVVAALLGLFRSGAQRLRREPVELAELLARLPAPGLAVRVEGAGAGIEADADLLAAALLNLLDNARRHGAARVQVSLPAPGRLRLQDDGPGVPDARRQQLQAALDAQAYEGSTGLGLMLADRVARAHGGSLSLPAVAQGFAVELRLTGAASGPLQPHAA